MKYIVLLLVISSFGLQQSHSRNKTLIAQEKFDLKVVVTNIKIQKGLVVIGIYDNPTEYLKKGKAYKLSSHQVNGNQLEINVKNIPKGTYAISLYQDVNSDAEFNTNVVGIPLEPYGFSNGFNRKWSKPTFDDCKFEFKDSKTVKIELIQ
jgi:uncharacterized protein (DUF2141 family)